MLEEIWHEKGGISSTSKGLKKPVRNKEDLTLYSPWQKVMKIPELFLLKNRQGSHEGRCVLAHALITAKFMLNADWLDKSVLPYDWSCSNLNHHSLASSRAWRVCYVPYVKIVFVFP